VTIYPHSADDDKLAIRVLFNDASLAAYVATLPVPTCTPGDVNGIDGVTIDDVAPFVTVLLDPGSATNNELCAADVNEDMDVDGRDVAAMVAALGA